MPDEQCIIPQGMHIDDFLLVKIDFAYFNTSCFQIMNLTT